MMTPAEQIEFWQAAFDERAAILEYDDGMVRKQAEALARQWVLQERGTVAGLITTKSNLARPEARQYRRAGTGKPSPASAPVPSSSHAAGEDHFRADECRPGRNPRRPA